METQKSKVTQESRRRPALAIAGTLLVLLTPVLENWKARPRDSFPLSYYPMFSHKREATYAAQALVGINADGTRRVLPYQLAGSGGFNEVRRQIRARLKDKKPDALCRQVARRVSRTTRYDLRGVREVMVSTQTHDIAAFFAGKQQPLSEKTHATCVVPLATAAGGGQGMLLAEVRP